MAAAGVGRMRWVAMAAVGTVRAISIKHRSRVETTGLLAPRPPARRRGERAEGGRQPGKQHGASGAHLAQVAQPDEVIWHVPDRCDGCGAELTEAVVEGVVPRQVFDLPPLRLAVAEHRAERRRCACGTTTQAVFPVEARAAACYGPGVRALCCYLLVYQHLPVDRAARLLDDVLGVPVSTGTLAAVLAEGAAGLEGFRQVVREQLAAAEVAHFDETAARWRAGCTGSTRPPAA